MRKLANVKPADESNVDLTPMLDVVFILLIFFVVTATFLSESAIDAASSPGGSSAQTASNSDAPQNMLFELRPNNDIILNGEPRPVLPNALRANIDRLKAENPAATVIIKPSIQSSVQTMVDVMDAARGAGITDISIMEP